MCPSFVLPGILICTTKIIHATAFRTTGDGRQRVSDGHSAAGQIIITAKTGQNGIFI